MTDTDRQRLAAILGMLGSDHAGERAAAGLQAEAFRRQHGMTWEELLTPAVVLNIPSKQEEPPFQWPPYPDSTPPPYSGVLPAQISWGKAWLFATLFACTIATLLELPTH